MIIFLIYLPRRWHSACVLQGLENYLSIEFYEDKLRSKHLTTHCLFSRLEIRLCFLFFFNLLEVWDAGGWCTLQNLPLDREIGFFSWHLGGVLSFGFSAGVGMPSPILILPFSTHLRWNQWPCLGHVTPVHLGSQHPMPMPMKRKRGAWFPPLMLEEFSSSCLIFLLFTYVFWKGSWFCVFAWVAITKIP